MQEHALSRLHGYKAVNKTAQDDKSQIPGHLETRGAVAAKNTRIQC